MELANIIRYVTLAVFILTLIADSAARFITAFPQYMDPYTQFMSIISLLIFIGNEVLNMLRSINNNQIRQLSEIEQQKSALKELVNKLDRL